MHIEDQLEFGFSSVKGRQVKARFDGGEITSDGGLLLLKEADRQLGLSRGVAAAIPEKRQSGKIRHRLGVMVQQRIFGLAAGYEDLNDFDFLRDDALWQTACGSDVPLAGKSTLSRFELRQGREVAVAVNRLLVEQFIASFKKPPKELILDFDATDDRVHGQQQGRFFHGYYGDYCFLPLYVFCGEKLLCAYLRPADRDVARHSAAILKLLVSRLRQKWPKVGIIFRADSGFCRDLTLTWCDRHGVDYCVGLARNQVVCREAEDLIERARHQYEHTGQSQRLFGGVIYGAKTWRLRRHVIVKAEHSSQGSNPRFVVTSLSGDEEQIYDRVYCARGEMENRIKEQMMLFSDRTSSVKWWANQWRMLLSALAYTLIEHIRSHALEATPLARAQCQRIRLKLFKIGAVIVRTRRVVRIHLSQSYPFQALFAQVYARLRPG